MFFSPCYYTKCHSRGVSLNEQTLILPMEDNYTQTMKINPFNEDAFFMSQVVGDDYELLLIDMLLAQSFKEAFKEVD